MHHYFYAIIPSLPVLVYGMKLVRNFSNKNFPNTHYVESRAMITDQSNEPLTPQSEGAVQSPNGICKDI